MSSSPTRHPLAAASALFKTTALAAVLYAAMGSPAHAQTVPPASGAGAGESASERASREGDKVFQWIRMHADKPRKAAVPEKAPVAATPAPAAVKVAAKPAPKPADSGSSESVQSSSATAKAAQKEQVASLSGKPPTSSEPPPSQTAAAATDASAPLSSTGSSPQVEIEEDVSLVPVTRSEPEFPGALMRQLRKGLVQVAFTVQPDGSVSQAHALSSTHPRLAAPAIATVAQWKFQPVRHAQQAVVELGFNLE
jgi:TonB family protein